MNFKEIVRYEKRNMNSIRKKVNYIVLPIYVGITLLILLTVIITMSIDEEKYNTLAIVLFSLFGLLCIGILVMTPFVRKVELKLELSKYNFDEVELDDTSVFYPVAGTVEETEVTFKDKCLELYGEEYEYTNFDIRLVTSHRLNLVNLNVIFTLMNSGSDSDPYLQFKLDGRLISAINKYNIQIENRKDLDYIINNKEDAFKRILNFGYLKTKVKKSI